jgi:two-component system response regulator PhoP
MHLLLVEDDDALRGTLAARLTREGHRVVLASDGGQAVARIQEDAPDPDIAILDLGLPEVPGIEVLKAWREAGKTFPVLVLTARETWQDKVAALGAGADDYLVKPFHFEELSARLQALLRRAGGWSQSRLSCGPVVLDLSSQSVSVAGAPVSLTTFEYRLLEYLITHAGQLVARDALSGHLYGPDTVPDSNALEVFVGRVRKKIDPDGVLKPIETVRGRGYRFALPRD